MTKTLDDIQAALESWAAQICDEEGLQELMIIAPVLEEETWVTIYLNDDDPVCLKLTFFALAQASGRIMKKLGEKKDAHRLH